MQIDFESLLNPDNFLWPQKGDRLLREANNADVSAAFDGNEISRHIFIGDGHMIAGARLIESCGESRLDRHLLIYPILSCYRQGLELAMKWVIAMYGKHANVSLSKESQNHNLWGLWKLCNEVIEKICGSDSDKDATAAVEQIIKDFHDLDKGAQAFRYPTTKSGKAFRLPGGLYDLNHLKESMQKLDNFFTGLDGMLDDYTSSMR